MGICIALLRGCSTGRDSSGDMTYLFASMIFYNGVLMFLDECNYALQRIPSLRILNLFIPFYFVVDKNGNTSREKGCLLAVVYVVVAAAAIFKGMHLAKISRNHKAVIKM